MIPRLFLLIILGEFGFSKIFIRIRIYTQYICNNVGWRIFDITFQTFLLFDTNWIMLGRASPTYST